MNVFIVTSSSPPIIVSLEAFETRLAVAIGITIALAFLAPVIFRTIVVLRSNLLDHVGTELGYPMGRLRLDGRLAALRLDFFSVVAALCEGAMKHSNAPILFLVRD